MCPIPLSVFLGAYCVVGTVLETIGSVMNRTLLPSPSHILVKSTDKYMINKTNSCDAILNRVCQRD